MVIIGRFVISDFAFKAGGQVARRMGCSGIYLSLLRSCNGSLSLSLALSLSDEVCYFRRK